MRSEYGSLFTKNDREGKTTEYIVRWHEKESKVRHLFSGLQKLILNGGNVGANENIEFPFNSLVLTNTSGIYQYICQQFYPSYFLYPDMFGEPEII